VPSTVMVRKLWERAGVVEQRVDLPHRFVVVGGVEYRAQACSHFVDLGDVVRPNGSGRGDSVLREELADVLRRSQVLGTGHGSQGVDEVDGQGNRCVAVMTKIHLTLYLHPCSL
jgi:hypothetical protein